MATELIHTVAQAAAEDGPLDVEAVAAVANLHWHRHIRLPANLRQADLNAAVHLFSAAYDYAPSLVPPEVRDYLARIPHQSSASARTARACNGVAVYLFDWYQATGDLEHVHEPMLGLLRRAVETASPDDPRRPRYLLDLGRAAVTRFERRGDGVDLDEAVKAFLRAATAVPGNAPDRATYLSNLGASLQARFRLRGETTDLDRAITVGRQAVDASSGSTPEEHVLSLVNLAGSMQARFGLTRERADLDQAIAITLTAIDVAPGNDPERPGMLSNLSAGFKERYDCFGDPADLDSAVTHIRAAVHATQQNDHRRHMYLANFSYGLRIRYERLGDLEDLSQAVSAMQAAAAAVPQTHPQYAAYLADLSETLVIRFDRLGEPDDLDQAITACQSAVNATPETDRHHAGRLLRLSEALLARFDRHGDPADLDRVIDICRTALDAEPGSHLTTLINALRARYELRGDLADLDEAIARGQAAVAAAGATLPHRPAWLSNVGFALGVRFRQSGNLADLDEAIKACQDAADTAPHTDPYYPGYLSGLGVSLQDRFERLNDPADLDKAIALFRRAVDLAPDSRPRRVGYLTNLSRALEARFTHAGERTDLDQAVAVARAAVQASPEGHPHRADIASNLARILRTRFGHFGRPDDYREVIDICSAAADSPVSPIRSRIAAAHAWGALAATAGDADAAAEGFATAVNLLPMLAWRGLERASRERLIDQWPGLVPDAAAWAIETGRAEHAVELLEQGRAVLWSQLLQTQTDLSALTDAAPDIAARLEVLLAALHRQGAVSATPSEDTAEAGISAAGTDPRRAADERMRQAREFDELVDQVRDRDGFAHFMAPVPFQELRQAAAAGSVVIINTGRHRCDALIVTLGSLQVIPLTDLTLDSAIARADAFLAAVQRVEHGDHTPIASANLKQTVAATLQWLWDSVTHPILTALGYTTVPETKPWPRLWWCPTGPLTVLPLHAAGSYHCQSPTDMVTVQDRVISSYTPTLAALLRSRNAPARRGPARLLAVGMPETPGLRPLPAVPAEIDAVTRHFTAHNVLFGPEATVSGVLAHVPAHSWVHLACHGAQNLVEPSKGAIHVHNGRLTVLQIAELRLRYAELAFLSACQTAIGGVRLLDEAVHLAAALQLAGYRHVIATLWSISDEHAPEIADAVYEQVTEATAPDSARAAQALHHAVSHLRRRYPDRPAIWASYLHIGP